MNTLSFRGVACIALLACLLVLALSLAQQPPVLPQTQQNDTVRTASEPLVPVLNLATTVESFEPAKIEPSNSLPSIEALYALIESDPEAAALLIEQAEFVETSLLALALVKHWSVSSPEAALAWLESQQALFTQQEYLRGLKAALRHYAVIDPSAAFDYLFGLSDLSLLEAMLFDIAGAWADRDVSAAWVWLQSVRYFDISASAIESAEVHVMQRYAAQQPLAAEQLARERWPASPWQPWLIPVARALANRDEAEAIAWANQLEDTEQKAAALAVISEILLITQPQQALEILLAGSLNLDHPDTGAALQAAVFRSPDYAKSRLANVDEQLQPLLLQSLVKHQLDANASDSQDFDWLQPFTGSGLHDDTLMLLVDAFAADEPQTAMHWALQLSSASKQAQAALKVIHFAPYESLSSLQGSVVNLAVSDDVTESPLVVLQARMGRGV